MTEPIEDTDEGSGRSSNHIAQRHTASDSETTQIAGTTLRCLTRNMPA
jgi:hypothetical protein